ncbi:MAG TPA: CYTH and CHAD domain-containing protein [Blastococcus sp.]|nr:CYTH and CHAD domain-containing protein [Blastococcus sp.]
MVSGHLEVESKYDVDEGFAVPDLTDLPGVASIDDPVEHHLEAVYFDTADLRLLRARVTLRRRTGGPDAGWHLKLPAGAARRELHAPLGRATKKPPPGLLEPVAGVVRGQVPAPVATLHTRRVVTSLRGPDGVLLAEVADDTVTASVPPTGPGSPVQVQAWREVEVELGTGDDALAAAAGDRLLAAGARRSASASKVGRVLGDRLAAVTGPVPGEQSPGTAGEFVLGALGEQVAALQAADVLLRTDQPGAVDGIRAAAGRLRSILAVFGSVLDATATESLRDELAWLDGRLAAARDTEAALDHLREVVAAQPEELVLGGVGARLQQMRIREGQAGSDRARRTLSEGRYVALLDALHAVLADPPFTARAGGPVRRALRKATRRSARELRRRLAVAGHEREQGRPVAPAEAGTVAADVRFVAELGRGQVPHGKRLRRATQRAHQLLTELQDTQVTRELCRRLGIVAHEAGENSFTYGRLHALEEERAKRAARDLEALLPDLRAALR